MEHKRGLWVDFSDPSMWHPSQNDDSDEEEQCTISDPWALQRESQHWSRAGSSDLLAPPSPGLPVTSSCESVLTELSATSLPAITVSLPPEPADLPLLSHTPSPCDRSLLRPTQGPEGPQDKAKKHRSRSFLKHLESLRRKEKGGSRQAEPEHSPASSEKATKASSFRSRRAFFSAGFYRAKNRADTSASGGGTETRRAWEAWPVATFRHPPRAHRGDCLVHVPRDHKPGTFPRSLSIESLCPQDGHRLADWQPGRRWGCEGRRGSCGSTGSHASTYDNMPELYSAEPVLAQAEAEEEEEAGGSYAHLDDILKHVWGLQQRVELWSQAMYPDLGLGDKEEEEDEEEEEEAASSVEIATIEVESQSEAPAHRESSAPGQAHVQAVSPDKAEPQGQAEVTAPALAQGNEQEATSGGEPTSASSLSVEEGQSISDTVASSNELDSSGNSMNEAEAAGSLAGLQASAPRERRDSGVGASLTRPCRWEFRVGVGAGALLSLSFLLPAFFPSPPSLHLWPPPQASFFVMRPGSRFLGDWVVDRREIARVQDSTIQNVRFWTCLCCGLEEILAPLWALLSPCVN